MEKKVNNESFCFRFRSFYSDILINWLFSVPHHQFFFENLVKILEKKLGTNPETFGFKFIVKMIV